MQELLVGTNPPKPVDDSDVEITRVVCTCPNCTGKVGPCIPCTAQDSTMTLSSQEAEGAPPQDPRKGLEVGQKADALRWRANSKQKGTVRNGYGVAEARKPRKSRKGRKSRKAMKVRAASKARKVKPAPATIGEPTTCVKRNASVRRIAEAYIMHTVGEKSVYLAGCAGLESHNIMSALHEKIKAGEITTVEDVLAKKREMQQLGTNVD